MKYKKVTAIMRCSLLEQAEKALLTMGIKGISVTQVHGYGEYHNFYQADQMCEHARIEIFCLAARAQGIAECIMDAAYTGQSGDGIVAILPVEELMHIRSKEALNATQM